RPRAAPAPAPDPELEEERRGARTNAGPAVLAEPEAGCPYNPRCPLAEEICFSVDPPLLELAPAPYAPSHVAARDAGLTRRAVSGPGGGEGLEPSTRLTTDNG